MELRLLAIGRARGGAEAALTSDWLARAGKVGRAVALGPATLVELEDRKGRGADAEGALILEALPDGAALVALDERGRQMTSPGFADLLAGWRDDGVRCAAFAIGGADGHAQAVRDRADVTLGLGPMVWPHMLARAMIAEQLYRAASILAGTPYHRGG